MHSVAGLGDIPHGVAVQFAVTVVRAARLHRLEDIESAAHRQAGPRGENDPFGVLRVLDVVTKQTVRG